MSPRLAWWSIARPNGTPSYGWGTEDDAHRVAAQWSDRQGLDVDRYQVDEAPYYDETVRDDGFDATVHDDDLGLVWHLFDGGEES